MRRLIVLAFALLLSTPSFATNTPPPKPTPPVVVSSPGWLGLVMASGILVFVLKHCKATKQC
jgi:hypothetical protein